MIEFWSGYPGLSLFWLFLIGASLVAWRVFSIKAGANQSAEMTELRDRSRSWFIILVALGMVLTSNMVIFLTFTALLAFFSLREFLQLRLNQELSRRSLIAIYFSIPLQCLFCLTFKLGYSEILIPAYAVSVFPIGLVNQGQVKSFTTLVGHSFVAMMISVFCIFHFSFVVLQADSFVQGAATLAAVIIIVQLNDVFQYCSGKLFGKRKVAPLVSKNKTLEGLIGGVLVTTGVGCFLLHFLLGYPFLLAAVLSFFLGLLGFYGDLFLSAIKRDHGIKDFSTLIPGHGGALDRLDSLTLTVPFFFYLSKALLS